MSDYSHWLKHYEPTASGMFLKRTVEKLYLRLLRQALGEPTLAGKRLLEIGPGLGVFGRLAVGEGAAYTCVERSPEIADRLEADEFRVLRGDFARDRDFLGGETFDIVYASHVIEHCDTCQEACRFVANAAACLVPGGVLMLNAPNFLSHGKYFSLSDYSHNYVTTPLRLERLTEDNGFAVLLTRETLLFFERRPAVVLLKGLFRLVPAVLFDTMGKLMLEADSGNCVVYGRSNFSVVAKKR